MNNIDRSDADDKPLVLLVTDDDRRPRRPVTIDEHAAWQQSFDQDADDLLADPLRDHVPQTAAQRKVRGVLSILDQLDRENSNRRFTT